MSIVTRTGDTGTTSLYGEGGVSKDDTRIHAYGTVDELNALLGVILTENPSKDESSILLSLQKLLFRIGADLASPSSVPSETTQRIRHKDIETIEGWIIELERNLPPLTSFILPGGSRMGSILHQARTVCRRAERWTVALGNNQTINPDVLIFLNRLGDLLFLLARQTNHREGIGETTVSYED